MTKWDPTEVDCKHCKARMIFPPGTTVNDDDGMVTLWCPACGTLLVAGVYQTFEEIAEWRHPSLALYGDAPKKT